MSSLLANPLFQDRKFFPTNVDKKPKVKAWKSDALKAQEALDFWKDETNFAMPTGEGLMVIDVDPKNGGVEEEVYKLGFPRGTFKVRTPSGGVHLYYRPEGFTIQNGAHRLGQGIDVRSDGGYVCVPPKPGYVVECDYVPKAVQAIEVRAALAMQAEKKLEPLANVAADPELVIPEGARNDTLFREGCSLRAKGVPEIVLRAGLQAMNAQLCHPPLSDRDLEIIVQQALKYMPGEQQDDGLICKWWNAKELHGEFGVAKETFAWEKWIPEKMASMVVARGGQGKSTLLLYILQEVLEKYPDRNVLWLPVENNMYDTRIKMGAIGLGEHPRFYIGGKAKPGAKHGSFCFDFSKPGDIAFLRSMVQELKPKVVVIDSLRAMSSVDINQKGIGDVMSTMQSIICEESDGSLVYIHHCNKKLEGRDVDKIMGNASIDAQVRVAYSLEYKDKETRVLKPIKSNLLEAPPYMAFIRDVHGYNHQEVDEDFLKDLHNPLVDEVYDEWKQQGGTRWSDLADKIAAAIGISKDDAYQHVNRIKALHGQD